VGVALNTPFGFKSVSNTLRMVGRNYGLKGRASSQKSRAGRVPVDRHRGLKIGLGLRVAHADRSRAGVSASRPGRAGSAGSSIESKNMLEIPTMFAGLLTVIIIGLVVENLIFRNVEPSRCGGGGCSRNE